MRDIAIRIVAIIALAAAAALAGERAEAAPIIVPQLIAAAHESLALTDKAQFMYGGRPYCWYRYGWAGPGWYWCGYGTRFGFGWGGAYGWNGWEVPRGSRPLRVVPRYRRYR
jgi:hypothetical protein